MKKFLQLKSEPKNIAKVDTFMQNILNEFSIDKGLYSKIYLAVTEGVNNAIFHGNLQDETKDVSLVFEHEGNKYIFTISDQGKGFDYKNIKDPTAPENLNRESGRGIFIMKQFASEVTYNKTGSSVTLVFKD